MIISSPPKVFLEKGVLKICDKFTEDDSCLSVKKGIGYTEICSVPIVIVQNFL